MTKRIDSFTDFENKEDFEKYVVGMFEDQKTDELKMKAVMFILHTIRADSIKLAQNNAKINVAHASLLKIKEQQEMDYTDLF